VPLPVVSVLVPVPIPLIVSLPVPAPVPFSELTVSLPIELLSDDSVALPELLQLNDINATIAMNNTRLIIFRFK